jgi:MFS transporter, PPP family, 3-phenylpropionic acid transporter
MLGVSGDGQTARSAATGEHPPPTRGGMWSLRLFYLIAGAGGAAFIPFFVLWLQDRGLSPERIGVLLAVESLAGAAAAPVWSHLADTRLGAVRVLLVSSLAGAVAVLGLGAVGSAFVALTAVAAAMSVCTSPGAPLSDALAVGYLGPQMSEYGRIRLWASLGWGVAVILFGAVYERMGLSPVVPIYAASLVVFGLWTLRLPRGTAVPVKSESPLGAFGDVFRQSPHLAGFIGGLVIVCVASYAALSFVSLRIVGQGGGPFLVGLAAGLAALIEIPVMHRSGALQRRFGLRAMFCAGAVAYVLVFVVWSFARSPVVVALVATLDGVAFALLYVGVVVIVGRLVPRHLLSTGQAVTQTAGWSLGPIIGSSLGGIVYARLGAPALFAGAAVLTLGGAAVVWVALAEVERSGASSGGASGPPAGDVAL